MCFLPAVCLPGSNLRLTRLMVRGNVGGLSRGCRSRIRVVIALISGQVIAHGHGRCPKDQPDMLDLFLSNLSDDQRCEQY